MSRIPSLFARSWFLAFIPLVAVAVFAGPRGSVESSSIAASSDTAVVYGPLQHFAGAVRVERIDLAVDPTRRYTVRVRNGAPDGAGRVTGGRIAFDNWTVLSSSELATTQYEWDKVVRPRGGDTLVIDVTGRSGSYVTVDVLETADASYALFGPERFTRNPGRPQVYTRTLNVSAGDAAPYRLCVVNGNPEGTQRLSNVTIRLNGTEVVSRSQGFSGAVASLVQDAALVQGTNSLEITLPSQHTGFIDVCATATDVTPPVIAIAAPAAGFATRDTQVTVSGTVDDQTATRVAVNGQLATRNGKGYSAVVALSTDGPKTIHVTATDGAGLTTDSTRSVIRDTKQPLLTVSSPADHSSTGEASVIVSGSVTDQTAVAVNANGVSLPVDSAGRFAGSVPLTGGANVVTVTATDGVGNQAVVVRSVTRAQLVTRKAGPAAMMAGPLGPSSWPNEPAGSNVVMEQTWDSLKHGWTIEERDSVNLTFAQDASAPFSPSGVLQARFPVGDSGGVLGNVLNRPIDVSPTPRVYAGIWFKVSKPWHAPGPNIQYLGSDKYGSISMVVVDSTLSDSGPYKLEVQSINWLTQNVNPNVSFTLGAWHKIEWLVDFSDTAGKVKWWLDGTLLGDYAHEPVPSDVVFNQYSSYVEWHQWDTPKPQTDYFWYDHTHLSVPPAGPTLPPDPATVATPLDSTVTTTVFASTGFLYTGTNPIQTGVASGTINSLRAAVVRGRTLARDGTALSGVAVTILGRPEFGQTLSRADGRYDLVVNGGGPLTVALNKSGFLTAQRPVDVPWQDYASVDDVVMIPVDGTVTTIAFANPTEVARGSVVHDTDGTRQGSLIFKQGTQATMILPDGSQQPLTSMNVRVTEYTVGANGLKTMPAPLPAATAYTYAAEFSADEAISAGATDVRFSQAVPFYLENFLGFPVGMAVPMGWYDRTRATWIPSRNGRVVQIVSVTGGLANLDITGDGVADDATSLGVNDAERQRLALLYATGQKLWRIPVMHFTPWDANDTQKLTVGQDPPDVPPAGGGGGGGGPAPGDKQNKKKDKDDPSKCPANSIVECENQTLGETIRVTGTALSLNYRSDRVPGRVASHELVIPLSGNTLPPGLVGIRLRVSIAGQVFEDSFPPIPNQSTRFVWDGKDVYGRTVLGIQPVTVRIGYEYLPVYSVPAPGDTSFGKPGGAPLAGVATREPNTVTRDQRTTLGGLDPRAQGFGGWTLSVHHAYDPIGGVLYMGDGTRRSALTLGQTITTVAGNGVNLESGDGGPATRASIQDPETVLPAPDGSYYITGPFGARVRKVGPDGIIGTVAGNGSHFTSGPDSGIAVQMPLNGPWGLALAPDGSLYIAEWNGSKIRRVRPDGVMTTVAGTGVFGYSGDGGPATAARLNAPIGLAFGPDGSLYIGDAQNNRVRRIGPDGIITTAAGSAVGGFGGDGGLATNAMLNFPTGVAVSARGDLYIADQDNNRVRRVSTEGIITTLAGTGTAGFSGDGGPATQAALARPEAVSVGPSGEVYIVDWDNGRVRVVTPDGTIRTVAGTGDFVSTGDGGSPLSAGMDVDWASVGPNGVMYVGEGPNNRVRAIRPTPPGLGTGEILIAAADGSEFYRFSPAGRHLSTIDAHTASTTYSFSYSSAGWLTGITDADNNVTVIDRDAAGVPLDITSPFTARTTLSVNSEGFLNRVTDPAGQVTGLHYLTGGLLDTLTTPRGFKSRYTYDSIGRLTRDQGPSGEDLTIVRTELATATETRLTTAQGRSTVYHLEPQSTGALLRKTTDPAGLVSQVLVARSDSFVSTAPNGTVTTMKLGPDPRAGMLSAILPTVTTQTPGGRSMVVTSKRVTTRPDSTNPLSLTSQVDSVSLNGQWSVTSYTASTRHFVATSPEGRQRSATLDAKGRIIATQTVGLDSARFTFDNLGRLSQQQVGGRVFTYSYDTRGRLLSTLDPLGRRDSLFYDQADRLTRRVLPDGRVVLFGYDSSGNLRNLTPPSRPVHGFQYTASDLTQEYDPPGIPGPKPTRYFYNRDKQLDSIVRPDSIKIAFGYDAGGRPSSVTFDRGSVTFGYSPTTGNLIGMRAPTGDSLTFAYDGSLPTQARWVGSVAGTVGVTYNNDFRVSSQTVNGANAVSFGYDRDGLLTSAGALHLGRSTTNGLLLADTLGSVRSSYQYTSRGELKGYHVVRSGTTLFGTGYGRDSLGRITQLFDTTQGAPTRWSFVYDSVGRLAADSMNGAVFHAFTYDGNGNRLTFTSSNGTVNYSYDGQDRLLSAGTTTYTYGSNGEWKTKTVPGVGTTTYTYDALGNLMTVILPTGTRIDYVIDGQNRRVGRKVNGVLVQGWLYQNQLSPVAELDGSGNVVSRFVYGSRTSVPDYVTKNGVTYRLVGDHLGSVRLVVDTATGTVAQRIDYDEWGNISQNTNPGFQPFGFAGGLYDGQTGLVRFGARDYDATIGRWTTRDPILFGGGALALYTYAAADPVNATDPSGLLFGGLINAGECAGEAAAEYWAQRANEETNFFARQFDNVMGAFASLWTPETSDYTFATLSTALGVANGGLRVEFGRWGSESAPKLWHFHWGEGLGLQSHHLPYQLGDWLLNLRSLVGRGMAGDDLTNIGVIGAGALAALLHKLGLDNPECGCGEQ